MSLDQAREGLPRWVIGLGVGFAVLALLWSLRAVLTPIFFAFLIAYLLDPLVDRLEEWRLPRGAAIVVLLALVLTFVALAILLVLPTVLHDIATFTRDLPPRIAHWMRQLEPTLAAWGVTLPSSLEELAASWHLDLQAVAGKAFSPAAHALRSFLGGTASVVGAAAGLLMVPVFAFYLLYDFDRITAGIGDLVPRTHRVLLGEMAREVDQVLSQFVRGQLIVMLALALLYSAGYALVGIPLAVPIGLAAGMFSFIPYVGGAVALVLGLLMCAFDFTLGRLGGVLLVYGVVQVLEGFVLTPRIVGDKVGLKAVWVLFALMVGGELFGFLGILLALPVAAVAKIFVVRAVAHYRVSELYLGDEARVLSEPQPAKSSTDESEPAIDGDAAADPETTVEPSPYPTSTVEDEPPEDEPPEDEPSALRTGGDATPPRGESSTEGCAPRVENAALEPQAEEEQPAPSGSDSDRSS